MPGSFRLLLLSLSGVRVRDRELLRLGLTLPGFVERSEVIASLPSLGLLTLAAWTPPGWEVHYLDLDQVGEPEVARILAGGYDLVAISALTARIRTAYRLSDRLRAAGVRTAIGGLHASALPEEAAAHADAVVVGEGEPVWPVLLADLAAGRLQPIYRSAGRPWSFARCRTPRYDLLDLARYNRIPLQTTRGCPLACHFCAASRTISPYRKKPIAQLRREIEAILALWPRPFIELADDNTFVDRRWSRELLALLAEYPLRWFTETDLSIAGDPELLDLLGRSGCAQVLVGLESPDAAGRRGLDPTGRKERLLAHTAEKVARIQQHGVSVNGCLILGLDSHGPEVFERTARFVERCGMAEVQITLLTPFPGTALFARLAREGRLLHPADWDRCTLFDVTYRPARMSVEQLEAGFRELMRTLYRPEAVARRKAAFRACRRARRTPDSIKKGA